MIYKIREFLIKNVPKCAKDKLYPIVGNFPTRGRRQANAWLREHCADICGKILTIGGAKDTDGQGGYYRDYFKKCDEYLTSEYSSEHPCDLVLDIRSMPEIQDESFDGILCLGVLEHVDNYPAGFKEMTRILKRGGALIVSVPFGQEIHMAPHDFWRFTEYGVRHIFSENFEIINLKAIEEKKFKNFPSAYIVKAFKK